MYYFKKYASMKKGIIIMNKIRNGSIDSRPFQYAIRDVSMIMSGGPPQNFHEMYRHYV